MNGKKLQGVPKKTLVSVQRLLEVLKSDLQIKVGWVLKNSGNFQSNEHRNFVFLPKNAWDIKVQSWLPLSQNNAFEQQNNWFKKWLMSEGPKAHKKDYKTAECQWSLGQSQAEGGFIKYTHLPQPICLALLRIPRHPWLLILAQNLRVLWPPKQRSIFSGTPCSYGLNLKIRPWDLWLSLWT